MEAMIFMMIFGGVLLLAAGLLAVRKDPRNSILLYKVHGLRSMPVEEARSKARQIAKIVAIIGAVIVLVFGIVVVVIAV